MSKSPAAVLKAGWGAADITPQRTAELFGQYYHRVARSIRDPLGVTALALEHGAGGGGSAQAILVSCDQAMVDRPLVETVRGRLAKLVPDFDPASLVISCTHTHCAPAAHDPLQWWKHDPALLSTEEFRVLLLDGLSSAAADAWRSRAPSQVGVARGLASVGHSRRAHYQDGSSEMYGSTARPDFVGMESGQDDTVGVIGVWNLEGKLTGILTNVACPSQVMEATYVVTADMFGEMRRRLKERFGDRLFVLCQIGAAGDQSPRDLTRPWRSGPTYWDEEGLVELGGRLAEAVAEALPRAQAARKAELLLRHEVRTPRLPARMVSLEEYARAAAELAALAAREPADPQSPDGAYARFVRRISEAEKTLQPGPYDDKNDDFVLMRNLEAVVKRFQTQRREPDFAAELHLLRLGDTALTTSPFELYLDYGMRIRARSPAALTLHAQLSCDEGGYLPTARAVKAGGYGALVANGLVGPEGGQLLVEHTLEALQLLFAD